MEVRMTATVLAALQQPSVMACKVRFDHAGPAGTEKNMPSG